MLKVGDKAPLFHGMEDQNGGKVSLSDFLAPKSTEKKIILYFYPKDNTPGCTAEACSLRDGYTELVKKGFVVIGVSADSVASHQKFIEKHQLPFALLSDPEHTIAEAYGTWGEKKFMGKTYMGMIRKTFIINAADGKIERIFDKVNTKAHFEQILDTYEQ